MVDSANEDESGEDASPGSARRKRNRLRVPIKQRVAAWQSSFSWVLLQDGKVFCSLCRAHAPLHSSQYRDGYAAAVNMTRLREHNNSVVHANSVQAHSMMSAASDDLDAPASTFPQSPIAMMMRNALWLAKEMVAMRKFPSINQLCASHSCFNINIIQYNSHTYCREFDVRTIQLTLTCSYSFSSLLWW